MTTNDKTLIPMQKHIKPLNMNGLSGRMLKMPSQKGKRNMLMVYGHHSSLERMYGIAEAFSEYGDFTVPDLPGFGGMDSFYKIGMKPTLDNFADYLASFIKLQYKGKKVTLVGMSLGFVIVTRMLQRYPELTKKVDILISVVGFTHHYDFKIANKYMVMYRLAANVFKRRLPSILYNKIALNPTLIRKVYAKTPNGKTKLSNLSSEEYKKSIEFEVHLWRSEDTRTYWSTAEIMANLNNCDMQVDLEVHHISVGEDQYFDAPTVEQHMRVIFNDFHEHVSYLDNHTPSILATKEDADPFIPDSIKKILRKKSA